MFEGVERSAVVVRVDPVDQHETGYLAGIAAGIDQAE
jgi:hypothetical protein